MLFEISKDLGKSFVTHILLAEELTKKNQNILTLIKLRFAKIDPREIKSTRNVKKNDSRK